MVPCCRFLPPPARLGGGEASVASRPARNCNRVSLVNDTGARLSYRPADEKGLIITQGGAPETALSLQLNEHAALIPDYPALEPLLAPRPAASM